MANVLASGARKGATGERETSRSRQCGSVSRDEGCGLTDEGRPDGLQAPRHGAGALAPPRRRTSAPASSRRDHLRGWRPAGGQDQCRSLPASARSPSGPEHASAKSPLKPFLIHMRGLPIGCPPRATNAHCGEALTCSGPPGGGYLRAGRRLLRTQRLDELRDRGADLVGAVLLDEVRPVDRGLGEVGPRPDERADPAALEIIPGV